MFATKSTKLQALAAISAFQADLGGTNLKEPLELACRDKLLCNTRQIFLITDGDVNNPEDCIEIATKNCGSTRVFTIGIGYYVNEKLCNGIAKAGYGSCMLVKDQELDNLSNLVSRQLQRLVEFIIRISYLYILDLLHQPILKSK